MSDPIAPEGLLAAIDPDEVAPVVAGPGCYRRVLPTNGGVRTWIVDMDPGSRWPYAETHGEWGEQVLVLSGELIEGEQRFGPGTFVLFGPYSRHQPRTDTGVRLLAVEVL